MVTALMNSSRDNFPPPDRPWDCVPIMGMSTFIRWSGICLIMKIYLKASTMQGMDSFA